jgi:phosphatidylethanolamine/phosphatidyl-N-methylethanolamine N-methyltransferase
MKIDDDSISDTRLLAVRTFVWSLIKNPKAVGAASASSQDLADLITREISRRDSPVLELGAGTGSFTYALLRRGIPEEDLVLVDYGSDFARLLQCRFQRARILWCDATRLQEVPNLPVFGAVISGLPITILPRAKVRMILEGAFSFMRRGARFYQFTYSPRSPFNSNDLQSLGLKASIMGTSWKNLPPATVYSIERLSR